MASSKIEVQIEGLKDFQKLLQEMKAEEERFMTETIKELAAKLLRKVIKRTPVREGLLRRNWTVSDVRKNGSNYEIEVSNSTEYASYVEYGHRQTPGRYVPAIGKRLKKSWAKGKFMLTISEEELRKEAPAVIKRKISEWLKKLGG